MGWASERARHWIRFRHVKIKSNTPVARFSSNFFFWTMLLYFVTAKSMLLRYHTLKTVIRICRHLLREVSSEKAWWDRISVAFRSLQVHSAQITILCLNQEERGFVMLIFVGFVMSFMFSPRFMIIEEIQSLMSFHNLVLLPERDSTTDHQQIHTLTKWPASPVPGVVLLTTQSILKTIQAWHRATVQTRLSDLNFCTHLILQQFPATPAIWAFFVFKTRPPQHNLHVVR